MIAVLPLLIASAIPGQEAVDLTTQVKAAIAAKSPAQLDGLMSSFVHNDAGKYMTAQDVVGAVSGCSFVARRASPGRAGLDYLVYSCPERAKTATGCKTGDLTLGVDANDLSLHFIESVRYDTPECGPPMAPPPPVGGN